MAEVVVGSTTLDLPLGGYELVITQNQRYNFTLSPLVLPLVPPVVSGTAAIGQTLSIVGGAWVSYQWRKDGVAISGATGSTFLITGAMEGGAISVTGTIVDGTFATSDPTAAVTAPADPVISGGDSPLWTPATLSVSGTWYSYQWKEDGVAIPGETGSTLAVGDTLDGGMITVTVSMDPAVGYSVTSAAVGPVVAPIPHTMLANFETITTLTPSLARAAADTSSRKTLGTQGVLMEGTGQFNSASFLLVSPTVTVDWTTIDRISFTADVGPQGYNGFGAVRPQVKIGATTYTYTPPGASYSEMTVLQQGKVTCSVETAYLKAAGVALNTIAGSSASQIGIATSGITNNSGNAVIDAVIGTTYEAHLPGVIIDFEDLVADQFANARGALNTYGLKGTWNVPTALIGTTGKITQAELATLLSEGHGLGLDSTDDDGPFTKFTTVAAAVAHAQAMQATMLSTFGSGCAEDIKHIVAGDDRVGIAPDTTYTVTCDGTTTINLGSRRAWAFATPGQPLHVSGGTTVNVQSIFDKDKIVTDVAVPAGSRTLTLGGLVTNLLITAGAGTATVTVADASKVVDGMVCVAGYNCVGLTVLSHTATTITFDGNTNAGTYRLTLGLTSAEWWNGKLQAAIKASGSFKSLRAIGTSTSSGGFLAHGIPDGLAFSYPCVALSGTDSAADLTMIGRLVDQGSTIILYIHATPDATYLANLFSGMRTMIDAGRFVQGKKSTILGAALARAPLA